MDFSLAEPTRVLVEEIRAFMAAEVLPHDADWLQQPFSSLPLDGLRQQIRARGWWAPSLPREWGGMGLDLLDLALVGEILGQSPFGHYLFGCQAPDAGNMELLIAFGTPAQQERYLRPVAEGRQRGCFAMTEPDTPGSNPTQLACRARREGDRWLLSGRKWFATGADGATYALVMAVTDPEARPHQRASVFIAPMERIQLVRNIPIMGHPGDGWASHGELLLADVEGELLGELGAGFALGQSRLGPGRIHHCMRWIGVCERAFTLMVERAASRGLTSDKTLADQPLVQASAAALRARIDAARLLVLHTAWTIEREGFKQARTRVSLIKFHVAQLLQDAVDQALQVHGALGLTSDTVLAYFYGHERGARIYDGPDEVHLLSAGKQVLAR